MHELLQQPLDADLIMRKKKSIKRSFKQTEGFTELRIAFLGGSTTSEIKDVLELFLLDKSIKPCFYESGYNKWYEDSMFENEELAKFNPQLIILHTSILNLLDCPQINDTKEAIEELTRKTYNQFLCCWNSLQAKYSAIIIQNNFELPSSRICGNLEASQSNSMIKFVNKLNDMFACYADEHDTFYINDINYLSAYFGLEKWFDRNFYNLYKFAFSYEMIPHYAYNLAAIIVASLGKSKKCLVLDLDNTLWGGIIGDDGIAEIKIGHETAAGEGFYEFQQYVLSLKKRGVILAVCSKNDLEIAKSGFNHPDSVLKVDDFAAFIANWEPKHLNLVRIAKEINIGLDSLVFIDDNPAERAIVQENLPEVAVPHVIQADPSSYIKAIDQGHYFEPVVISADDLKRNQTYLENKQRHDLELQFTSYDDFLKSLEMRAEIETFKDIYLDRITQLTNKTNQFNLTTKRYTRSEIDAVAKSEEYIAIYGRLEDKFGDNGLVSVVVGKITDDTLHIDLWLMSCRVLKRDFEITMFQELVKISQQRGIKHIKGYYYKTAKNAMVKEFYPSLGFTLVLTDDENTTWQYDLDKYAEKELHILVNGVV